MDPLQKRFAMFLLGCIPVRLLIVYTVYAGLIRGTWLKVLAAAGALLAFGFLAIFIGGFRKTGIETGGAPIWWNILRPLHALMWALFAYFAWVGNNNVAWKLLLADVCIGLVSFFIYHSSHGNLARLLGESSTTHYTRRTR